jgi:hypothetical protein
MPKISPREYRKLLSDALEAGCSTKLREYIHSYPERLKTLIYIRDNKGATVSEVEEAVNMPGTTYAIFLGMDYGIFVNKMVSRQGLPQETIITPPQVVLSKGEFPPRKILLPEAKVETVQVDALQDNAKLFITEPFSGIVDFLEI